MTAYLIKSIFLIFLVLSFSSVAAEESQKIIVSVDPNTLDAYVNHSLPLNTNEYTSVDVSVPKDVGMMKIGYEFLGAFDSGGRIIAEKQGDKTYRLTTNIRNKGDQAIFSQFKVPVAYNTPAFVGYDFTVFTDALFLKKPYLEMNIPSSLEFLSSDPIAIQSNSIHIDYPIGANKGIIQLNFIYSELPADFVKKEVGIFTLIGTESEVKKLEAAVENLSYINQIFGEMVGDFNIDSIMISSADLSGKGGFYTDAGAFAREPNIIIFDKENLKNISNYDLQTTIVHEIAHLVILDKVFSGEEKEAAWFDEGIAVFFQNYAMDDFFNKEGYWIEKDENGIESVYWSNYQRFTKEQLKERYKGQFYFDIPKDSSMINDFYTHSGLVFTNFYFLTGKEGMKKLFTELSMLNSSGVNCNGCDTKKIINIMENISGRSEEELLFPYRNDPEFDVKVSPLVRESLTQEQVDSILANNKEYNQQGSALLGFIIIGAFILIIAVGAIFLVKKMKKKK